MTGRAPALIYALLRPSRRSASFPATGAKEELTAPLRSFLACRPAGAMPANKLNHPIVFGVMAFDEFASAARNVNFV